MPEVPPMVECTECKKWYHVDCVTVPKEAVMLYHLYYEKKFSFHNQIELERGDHLWTAYDIDGPRGTIYRNTNGPEGHVTEGGRGPLIS